MNPDLSVNTSIDLTKTMHDHWRLFLIEGIVLILLGLGAVLAPLIAGLASTVLLGWLFIAAGLAGLIITMRSRTAPGFAWSILSAALALLAGAALVWSPFAGLVTLTFVLTAFFVLDGVFMIVLSLSHRRELSSRWEWMLINGVIDLVLAAVIIMGLPGTLLWAFGLIVGFDLLFGGATLAAMALAARTTDARKAA